MSKSVQCPFCGVVFPETDAVTYTINSSYHPAGKRKASEVTLADLEHDPDCMDDED